MNRPFRSKRRLAVQAAVAAIAAAMAPGSAGAAEPPRTNDMSKPVVFVTGPETPTACGTLEKLRWGIEQYQPTIGGKEVRWSGSFKEIQINPQGNDCAGDGSVRIQAGGIQEAAGLLSKQLAAYSEKTAIDVVAIGTGGPVLRYAMLMSARKRAGNLAFGAGFFASRLDIEDVVTLGSALDGMALAPASCGGGPLCDDLVRPAAPNPKPIHWQLMDSAEQDGRNPQGIKPTDWSVMGFAGDRFAPPETATGMDAAHKTVYEDDSLTLQKALTDNEDNNNATLRFQHAPETEFTRTTKGPHVTKRVAQDLVFGVSADPSGKGPAYAQGCTGYNEGGSTIVLTPQYVGWRGDPQAVRNVKAGNIDAVANCFRTDPKVNKDVFYVSGNGEFVRINGIDFQLEENDSRLEINVKERTVKRTRGKVIATLPITQNTRAPLWHFPSMLLPDLNWKFPSADGVIQTDDGTVFAGVSPDFKLLGLKTVGGIALKVGKGNITLDLSVALPGIFSSNLSPGGGAPQCSNGIDDDKDGDSDLADKDCDKNPLGDFEDRSKATTFAATVGTSNATGLQLDKFAASFGGSLRFGPFRSEGSIGFEYDRVNSELKLQLEAKLPAVGSLGVKLKVGFKNGELSSVYGEFNGIQFPLWTSGWFLQRFGVGVSGFGEGKQLEILIATTFSFQRKIDKKMIASVDGELTVGWGTPWKFKLGGVFSVVDWGLGSGSLEYEEGVGGKFSVVLGRSFAVIPDKLWVIPQGTLAGQLSTTGDLDIGASVQGCFKGELSIKTYEEVTCVGQTQLRLTKWAGQPLTLTACIKSNLITGSDFSVGFSKSWKVDGKNLTEDIKWITHACDVADYGAKPSQTAAASTDGFTIRPGTDRQAVVVRGAGGKAPAVTLVAPDGTRYATPADKMVANYGGLVNVITGLGDATTFSLAKPQAGRWRVEPQEGSGAVSAVELAEVLPEPEVAAKVRREAGGFVLRHEVKAQPGQTVRFVERAGAVLSDIATSGGGKGETRFTPAFGPAGKREIVAVVSQDGQVRREVVVGSYGAPAPAKPGKVKRVQVTRKGKTVTVTWSKAQRATGSYEVQVRLPDGTVYSDITKRRKVVLRDVIVPGKAEVTVRALRKQDEASGPKKVAHARV